MLPVMMPEMPPVAETWPAFSPDKQVVEVFPRNAESLLLIHKKRGFGAGKVCGPGGHIERGETPEEAAIRETEEEIGLRLTKPSRMALLQFQFTDGLSFELHAFVADTWAGTLTETDEALPFWQTIDRLPYARMWADARSWLPVILDGRCVRGRFLFDEEVMLFSQLAASVP
jgi:8-oxo-dGTP diphosphatase